VTGPDTGALTLSDDDRRSLGELIGTYVARRPGWDGGASGPVELVDAEMVRPGRPGILDVVARVDTRLVHLALGLRATGEDTHFLSGADDDVLGLHEDKAGIAIAFDATRDVELGTSLLEGLTGAETDPARVRRVRTDRGSTTLAFEERIAFTVFDDVTPGHHRGLELFVGLDEVGFNHLAAPLSVWRRDGLELGVAQEFLAGGSTGWALAMTSVRDYYATGGAPEHAGGDFGGEALRLGIMTARMHLGLEAAFGHRRGDVAAWVDAVEQEVHRSAPGLFQRVDVTRLLAEVRGSQLPALGIRTHGDYQLSRVCRTEQGWYVMDFSPGGQPGTVAGVVPGVDDRPESETGATRGRGPSVPASDRPAVGAEPAEPVTASDAVVESDAVAASHAVIAPDAFMASDLAAGTVPVPGPTFGPSPSPAFGDEEVPVVFRSPIADVADMLWSFGRVAAMVAQERDPAGRQDLSELVLAWERRNRRAFLAGYLAVPGINGLVPPARDGVAKLATVFELARVGQMRDLATT
jgi:predicted trehalose synthase